MRALAGVRHPYEGMMLRTQKQSDEALAALHLHARLVIQSAARILGNLSDGEDIAQDLAERLLKNPPRDVQNWPALLKTMAVNLAIDRLRRGRKSEPLAREPATETGPPEALDNAQQAQVLKRALAQLSSRDATIYSLYYLADLKQQDIARQLSMTSTAVGVALHRVRQRLTNLVHAQLHPEMHPESKEPTS